MFNFFKILFSVLFAGMLFGCGSSHENAGYYEYERYTNPYYRPSDEQERYGEKRKMPAEAPDCRCPQGERYRRHSSQCERGYGNVPHHVAPPHYVVPQQVPQQYVQPQYVPQQYVEPQYVVPQQVAPRQQVVPQYVVPVYPQGYVPVQPSSRLQGEPKTAVAQNQQAETEDVKNSAEATEKKDVGVHFKKAGLQNVNLPKSMQCKMLYMEQWDELAQEVADEIFLGLGNQGVVSVSASGITPFKKGFRELLITALSRRGLSVVDMDGNVPVLEFDVLPVSKGRQISFFLGDSKENPIQIMVNTSISRLGRYMYRKSSIYAVPGEELSQYVEDEGPGSTPFKTYQLVSS